MVKRVFQQMLQSGQEKRIFWLVQTISLFFVLWKHFNEFFFPSIGERFSLKWKLPTLLESSFVIVETVTYMSGNHFLKTDPIFASGNSFYSQWKSFSSIVSDIFQEVFHPDQWKHIFQSRRKSIVFYLELLFVIGNDFL